jgi:hypothetical protein
MSAVPKVSALEKKVKTNGENICQYYQKKKVMANKINYVLYMYTHMGGATLAGVT